MKIRRVKMNIKIRRVEMKVGMNIKVSLRKEGNRSLRVEYNEWLQITHHLNYEQMCIGRERCYRSSSCWNFF